MTYPSYCCQRCGAEIGWLGRGFDWLLGWVRITLHDCKPPRPWPVDRDGRVRTDARVVELRAKRKPD